MIISSSVPSGTVPTNILNYLSARFTYLSRFEWTERMSNGLVLCNDIVCDEKSVVCAGDRIAYNMPDFAEPPCDMNYEIVYEDQWLFAVNKPGNLLVHMSGKSFRSNLIYHLRYEHEPTFPGAHAVSRLDRETSGIVCIAKDTATLRSLHAAFSGRKVLKSYLAIVHGVPEPRAGTISLPIGKAAWSSIHYRFEANGLNAKDAVTEYCVEKNIGKAFSLVRLFPQTGRTHQIRVHLEAIGHKVVGDKLYGVSDDDFLLWRADKGIAPDSDIISRHALHCESLDFQHPATGERCTVSAPMPLDMEKAIERLENEGN